MCKLAKKKPSSTKKAKRGKTKLTAQSIRGTWLGIPPCINERLLAVHTDEVVRVITIHRLLAEKQWEAKTVLAIWATPRSPGQRADPEPRLVGEREGKPEEVKIARSGHQNAHGAPRELRLGLSTARQIWLHRRLQRLRAPSTGARNPWSAFQCM